MLDIVLEVQLYFLVGVYQTTKLKYTTISQNAHFLRKSACVICCFQMPVEILQCINKNAECLSLYKQGGVDSILFFWSEIFGMKNEM